MMSLWDALRMNMMISYQELVRTFPWFLVFESCNLLGKKNQPDTKFPSRQYCIIAITYYFTK